jgi:hypothetical protein
MLAKLLLMERGVTDPDRPWVKEETVLNIELVQAVFTSTLCPF